jgi:GNAT superfamily N-acetyltransferase
MKTIPTKTTYLEMLVRPIQSPPDDADNIRQIRHLTAPSTTDYRDLYQAVGASYHWVDRTLMSDDELATILQDERVEIYQLEVSGQPAGFAELDRRIPREVELAYFGLFPAFIGHGHGKWFLARMIERAWTETTRRVWVHTCDLDHAAALPTYCKAGFQIYDEQTIQQVVIDSSQHQSNRSSERSQS